MQTKIYHILPEIGFGGVEKAASTLLEFENQEFKFKTIFLNNYDIHNKHNIFWLIRVFINFFKTFLILRKQKKIVLISSLIRSHFFSLFFKILNFKTYLIVFLNNSKNKNILDNIITSINILIANEVWADSEKTFENRNKNLLLKITKKKKRKISFILNRYKPIEKNKFKLNFIYWGRFHKRKNIHNAVKLFYKFYIHDNNCMFFLIGKDYGVKKSIEKLASELGISRNIKFFNYMEMNEIYKIAQDCSFFIQLSSYEGMAMSVVESMQLGLVPIITEVGEIENYCQDLKNGIIYEGCNKTFEKVLKVINDGKYSILSSNAIKTWKDVKTYREDMLSKCSDVIKDNLLN